MAVTILYENYVKRGVQLIVNCLFHSVIESPSIKYGEVITVALVHLLNIVLTDIFKTKNVLELGIKNS